MTKDKYDRTQINKFYHETLAELKHVTGLQPKSLIEKVGLRKICERVLPIRNAVIDTRLELAKDGTVEASMMFLDEFFGLRFNHYEELYHKTYMYDRKYGKCGDFQKYLKKVQEDSHLL